MKPNFAKASRGDPRGAFLFPIAERFVMTHEDSKSHDIEKTRLALESFLAILAAIVAERLAQSERESEQPRSDAGLVQAIQVRDDPPQAQA